MSDIELMQALRDNRQATAKCLDAALRLFRLAMHADDGLYRAAAKAYHAAAEAHHAAARAYRDFTPKI